MSRRGWSECGRCCRASGSSCSAPELMAGQCRALRQCLELGPSDLRVDAPAKTAIGRGDDLLAADCIGKAQDTLGDQFGVLDDVGGVADHARQDQLAVRELDVLPYLPLVLVAD